MSTIDNQLAFLSSSAFQSFSNVKNRKKFRKIFDTLRKYLPSDKRSLWPKELRKKTVPGWGRNTVVAFSGTMGASVTFGWAVERFLKDIKSWVGGLDKTHRDIFETIVNNRSLQGNIEDRYFNATDLMCILAANTAWPVIRYDGMDYAGLLSKCGPTAAGRSSLKLARLTNGAGRSTSSRLSSTPASASIS